MINDQSTMINLLRKIRTARMNDSAIVNWKLKIENDLLRFHHK